jgi:cation diffusion facilitator family transporter
MREKQGRAASIVGITVNICLAAAKMAVGLMFGIVSILADGLNNLTDCGSSLLSLLSFKLSSKPADKEHPFGHERIEYVFSMIVAFIILLVSFETAKESFAKIISPAEVSFSLAAIAVLLASIFGKCLLYIYYKRTAARINSEILTAAAADSIGHCVSTSVVLISLVVSRQSGFDIDGYAGVFVALFIAWAGIGVLRGAFSHLIGRAPDAELIENIKERVMSHGGVIGIHDLSVYSYGPNKYFASVHVEVDANIDVLTSHELVDDIERDFAANTGIILTGHLDPIIIDDERVNVLREEIVGYVSSLDERFSVHDFRMVFGEWRTNVLFDVAVPFDTAISKSEIKELLEQKIVGIDSKFCPIITIEYSI